MLTDKFLNHVAKITKLDIAVLKAAIAKAEEVDIPVDETVTAYTADELATLQTNLKAQGKTEGQAIGETIGKELAVKAIKSKFKITDASKDIETITNLVQTSLTGDDAVKEQVKLLQKDVKEREKQIEALNSTIAGQARDTKLLTMLPKNLSDILMPHEHLNLIKNNLEFTNEGIKLHGQILRDNLQNPLTEKDAIQFFYTKERPGLLKEDGAGAGGGRGGASSQHGTKKTLTDVKKSFEAANPGKTWGGAESQDYLNSELKKNPDILMEETE